MFICHPAERLHNDLVVIGRHIHFFIDRSQLMLRRRDLIVLRLGCYAKLPELIIDLAHIGGHPLADGAEVVIVHLLPFGRHRSKQRPAGIDQVLALPESLGIHKKILLLGSHAGGHLGGSRVSEKPKQAQGLNPDRFHGAKKRCLLVKRLTGV